MEGGKVVVLEISYALMLISCELVPYTMNKCEDKFAKEIPIVDYISETVCRPNRLVIEKIERSKPPFRWPKPQIDRTNGF